MRASEAAGFDPRDELKQRANRWPNRHWIYIDERPEGIYVEVSWLPGTKGVDKHIPGFHRRESGRCDALLPDLGRLPAALRSIGDALDAYRRGGCGDADADSDDEPATSF